MKSLLIICGVCLLIALAPLPIGYYTFLRIIVTIGAATVIVNEFDKENKLWLLVFVIIGILFNPILPVYLHDKSAWMPFDIISAILFFVKSSQTDNQSPES